ncbi:MAG: hypothetical protein LBM73_02760 [Candidatus Nomurabacteria bacterium]|jgi:hypothetical protein|nr:hypothetical protein [Candidatus Nomurabacteria bacterium]
MRRPPPEISGAEALPRATVLEQLARRDAWTRLTRPTQNDRAIAAVLRRPAIPLTGLIQVKDGGAFGISFLKNRHLALSPPKLATFHRGRFSTLKICRSESFVKIHLRLRENACIITPPNVLSSKFLLKFNKTQNSPKTIGRI